MKLLTPAEMQALDQAAVRDLGIPETVLMENAASAALHVLINRFFPQNKTGLILCGNGNNGGDGFALARKLHSLNKQVLLFFFGNEEKLSPVSRLNFECIKKLKIPLYLNPKDREQTEGFHQAGYLVDALFGTGLNRAVTGEYAGLIHRINGSGKPVLSLDIPSGVQGQTGAIASVAVQADACVTFGAPKRGNLLYPGFARQGHLSCSRISFPPDYYNNDKYSSQVNLPPPLPRRDPAGYKNSYGKILVIGGGRNYFGAPALASQAAFRSGAGFVTTALPSSLCSSVSTLCPEAVLEPLESDENNSIRPENFERLFALSRQHHMVILGPGITREPGVIELVNKLIPAIPVPLLIDADALHVLAGHPELSFSREAESILTPHKGEQDVLRACLKEGETLEQAYGAITLYKGPHSSIRTPEGEEFINLTGNSGLGTAGSGDVLTGVIAGLSAIMSPLDAVKTGVMLHGLAADLAVKEMAEESLTASDIVHSLPTTIKFFRENYTTLSESCYNTIETLP